MIICLELSRNHSAKVWKRKQIIFVDYVMSSLINLEN